MINHSYSIETLRCLNTGHLTLDLDFVRCVPVDRDGRRLTDPKERMAACVRIVADINEPGEVFLANNPVVGGDYVRVNQGTRAWAMVCQMRS